VLPTLRSLIAPEALSDLLRTSHGLDGAECVLIRSFVNDVYQVKVKVTTADRAGAYALKVYQSGRWSPDEVRWELELVDHVAEAGVPVPRIVPLVDGAPCGVLDAAEGPRVYALTEFIAGRKPQPPFDDALYQDFGALIATFHTSTADFASRHPRRSSDLATLLDRPIERVSAALIDRPDDRRLVLELGAEARSHLTDASAAGSGLGPGPSPGLGLGLGPGHGLEYGVCHGDVSLDNVFLGPDGLTLSLHDFDSAAPGWRASDLTGVSLTPYFEAFVTGYRAVRPLADVDLAAVPWFAVAGLIENLAFHLIDKPAYRGTESLAEGWVEDGLTELRELGASLSGR
jgi:Ser/Thr protein kinase RdoA (MazF antagonist)